MVCEVVPGGGWWESDPHLLEMALPHLLFKLIRMLTTGAVLEFKTMTLPFIESYCMLCPLLSPSRSCLFNSLCYSERGSSINPISQMRKLKHD